MGFNPLRRYRGRKTADIIILIVFTILLGALIVWATR